MRHVEPEIARWLAGQLGPEEFDRFEAHVLECRDCARLVAESRAVWDALGNSAVRREADLAPSVWTGVRARTIGRRQEPWFYGSKAWLRNGLAAGAVAAGLFCATLLPLGGQGAAQADDSDVDTIWLQDSSWTNATSDQNLDSLWLYAGVDTDG